MRAAPTLSCTKSAFCASPWLPRFRDWFANAILRLLLPDPPPAGHRELTPEVTMTSIQPELRVDRAA
jgi:hypothetical protein